MDVPYLLLKDEYDPEPRDVLPLDDPLQITANRATTATRMIAKTNGFALELKFIVTSLNTAVISSLPNAFWRRLRASEASPAGP